MYLLGWGKEGTVTITQDQPLPLTINGCCRGGSVMGVQMQIASVFLGLAAANKAAGAAKMEEQAYKEQAEMASIQADQQALERDTQLRKQRLH